MFLISKGLANHVPCRGTFYNADGVIVISRFLEWCRDPKGGAEQAAHTWHPQHFAAVHEISWN